MMELYTGKLLFSTHESVEHLALIHHRCGTFPIPMGKRAHEKRPAYFDSAGVLRWPEQASSGKSQRFVARHSQSLARILHEPGPHLHFATSPSAPPYVSPATLPSPPRGFKHFHQRVNARTHSRMYAFTLACTLARTGEKQLCSLLQCLLQVDPDQRWTPSRALKHPFLTEDGNNRWLCYR